MSAISELRFETTGRSMWPLLRPGDVVRAAPVRDSGRPVAPGDIVVYLSAQTALVAHRVVAVLPDGRIQVRGDFTFTPESPIEPSRIVGRITSASRGSRSVRLDGPVGRLLAFGIPRLERGAPRVLGLLRRTVIASVVLGDRVWTAKPVRRIRRSRGLAGRMVIARVDASEKAGLSSHLRRTGRDPRAWEAAPEARVTVIARRSKGPIVAHCQLVRRPPDGTDTSDVSWQVADIYVEHRWRGLGIGRRLILAALVEVAAREPSAGITAWLPAGDQRALQFFQTLGFKRRDNGPAARLLFVLGDPGIL